MHRKGRQDKVRSKVFGKLAREITTAAKLGLPDPAFNPRLRAAILAARAENMTKDVIERAIKKAQGGDAENYEDMRYEGYGPGGVAVIVETLTDNRNRTVGEIRAALTRSGGSLGENGSVSWMFDQMGLIVLDVNGSDPDELALVAIDAGADDVSVEDGGIEIYTQPQDLHRVQEELVKGGYSVESAELTMRPKTQITPESDLAVKVIRLVEKLEDLDDVQTVYTNLDITDDVLAAVT